MIVLDANVISEFQKPRADDRVRTWFEKTPLFELATCTPVILEMEYGSQLKFLRTGSRVLLNSLQKFRSDVIQNRVLDFDVESALLCARLRAEQVTNGNTRPVFDSMIAAICIANGATLATRNVADFAELDLKLVNPFEGP